MAQLLSQVAVGTIVKLNENGAPKNFYVAAHNYESGLNGSGRTLLVRELLHSSQVWDRSDVNAYAVSDIDSWFNTNYKNTLDENIQEAIGTTKFYYTPGNGNYSVTTLERGIFALSITEYGFVDAGSDAGMNVEGSALPIADQLKIGYLNGSPNLQLTRSPYTGDSVDYAAEWRVTENGTATPFGGVISTGGARPAFTLPGDGVFVDADGTILFAPDPPSSITVPGAAMPGQTIQVSWSAVDTGGES